MVSLGLAIYLAFAVSAFPGQVTIYISSGISDISN